MDQYEDMRCIGRGNFGSAHLVRSKASGKKYVIKRIPLQLLGPEERRTTSQEAHVLAQLDHPNVVRYKDSFVEDEHLHIVMVYCEGGDLGAQIKAAEKENRYFSEEQILEWFVQLALAVDYVHRLRILHRDLKSSNVFLTKNNIIKLGDFGIARVLDGTLDQAMTVVGTPYYMSPEVCESKPYSYKSDIWALGCILYEMCTLKHAFDASNLLSLVFKIVKEPYLPIPSHYSDNLRQLVKQLLSKSPSDRPTPSAIFSMPFIRQRMDGMYRLGGGTLGKRVVNCAPHVKPRAAQQERKLREREEHEEALALARQEASEARRRARAHKERIFRPSTAEHVALSSADVATLAARPGVAREACEAGGGLEEVKAVAALAAAAILDGGGRQRAVLGDRKIDEEYGSFYGGKPGAPQGRPAGRGHDADALDDDDDDGEDDDHKWREEAMRRSVASAADERPIQARGRYLTGAELDALAEGGAPKAGARVPSRRGGRSTAPPGAATASLGAAAAGPGAAEACGDDGDPYYSDDFESDDEDEVAYRQAVKEQDMQDLSKVLDLCRVHLEGVVRPYSAGVYDPDDATMPSSVLSAPIHAHSARSITSAALPPGIHTGRPPHAPAAPSRPSSGAVAAPQRAGPSTPGRAGPGTPGRSVASTPGRARSAAAAAASAASAASAAAATAPKPTSAYSQNLVHKRRALIDTLGSRQFESVYTFIRSCHEQRRAPTKEELIRMVGKDKLDACFAVEQLIFTEEAPM